MEKYWVVTFLISTSMIFKHYLHNRLEYACEVIGVMVFLSTVPSIKFTVITPFYTFLGYLLALPLLNISCLISRLNSHIWCKFPVPNSKLALAVIYEEVVWRFCLQNSVSRILCSFDFMGMDLQWLSILYVTIVFVFSHKQNSVRSSFEMVLYSAVIGLSYAILPGMNYGLHFGRNCIIAEVSRESGKHPAKPD